MSLNVVNNMSLVEILPKGTAMYYSENEEQLHQNAPPKRLISQFRQKGWCDSVESYLYEAGKLTQLLMHNRNQAKQPYTWFSTIYVDFQQAAAEVSAWWKKCTRNLKRHGIDALWVREPTRCGKVHYHMILRNALDENELNRIIERSLPRRDNGRWHMANRKVKLNDWRLLHYVSKAKCSGMGKGGRFFSDLYAKKRLLFKKNVGFDKYGTIGEFWIKRKAVLWSEIASREKRICQGLEIDNVKELSDYIYKFLDGTVSSKRIERNCGLCWDKRSVQDWIQNVFGSESTSLTRGL